MASKLIRASLVVLLFMAGCFDRGSAVDRECEPARHVVSSLPASPIFLLSPPATSLSPPNQTVPTAIPVPLAFEDHAATALSWKHTVSNHSRFDEMNVTFRIKVVEPTLHAGHDVLLVPPIFTWGLRVWREDAKLYDDHRWAPMGPMMPQEFDLRFESVFDSPVDVAEGKELRLALWAWTSSTAERPSVYVMVGEQGHPSQMALAAHRLPASLRTESNETNGAAGTPSAAPANPCVADGAARENPEISSDRPGKSV